MRRVEPRVFLIGETRVDHTGLGDYLRAIGAENFSYSPVSDAEKLVETGGRLCYRSFAPGLNENVTKIREGNQPYLANILASRHGSVLEHANVTFIFYNVSRVFTHELVRHRAGCAISQESLRYVRLTDIAMWMPEAFEGDVDVQLRASVLVQEIEKFQQWLAEHYNLNEHDFGYKKAITSAMRRFANLGLATSIMWTANFRTLRHVLQLRTEKAAEEEIRLVFDHVGRVVKERYPNVFQDFERTDEGEWKPEHVKV